MEKYFDIVVNENDETGIDFNSFVGRPAHSKQFISFGKEQVRYHFNEEKRIVTGVAIASNVWIYRRDEQSGEHYVKFSPQTIETIRRKFFTQGYNNNVNVDHDMSKIVKGATLIDSYLVYKNDPKYPSVPEAFKNQNIQDGSWIVSYYVTDDKLWEEVKNGRVLGFSIEGWFDKKKVNIKKANMRKQTKSFGDIFRSIFNGDSGEGDPGETQMAQVTAVDGTILSYDGELGEGTAVFVEVEGEKIPASEGDYEVTLEDGSVKVISVDANGMVTGMSDVEVMNEDLPEQVAEAMKALAKESANKFKSLEEKFDKRLKFLEDENKTLKAQLAGGKFQVQPKRTGEGEKTKLSASDLLNKTTAK